MYSTMAAPKPKPKPKPAGTKTCPNCGARMSSMPGSKCPECGKKS